MTKQCQDCGGLNRESATFCNWCGSSNLAPLTRPAVGALINGRYQIVRTLGQGGMGAVYLVEDQQLFGKRWAIKEMLDTFSDPIERSQAVQQFEREARLLVALKHPNLPQIAAYFEEKGRQYLVMEYVEGQTLEAVLEATDGFLPESQVVDWALQLCGVLEYLHGQEQPIIFRDLKPSNMILQPDGVVKLIDFGIARVFKPGRRRDTERLGTPGFAAPEQYGAGQTDARSDIYALGVTLHHLLTKTEPHAWPPFQLPPIRTVNPRVSRRIEAVIAKATQLQPEARFQTAAEMCGALEALNKAPSPAPPAVPGPPRDSERTDERRAAPMPLPLQVPKVWTVPLTGRLSNVKAQLFQASRTDLLTRIMQAVTGESRNAAGTTIMLRGIKGFGGTTIASELKDRLVAQGGGTTLVATVDLSAKDWVTEQANALAQMLSALQRDSRLSRGNHPISGELRAAISYTWERYAEEMGPLAPTHVEETTTTRQKLSPVPLSLELSTPGAKASLGSPLTRETEVARKVTLGDRDPEAAFKYLMYNLDQLLQYLRAAGLRVVIIFDKVQDIERLRPMQSIVSQNGVYSVVVANLDDWLRWKKPESDDLVRRFSKIDRYVEYLWGLPTLFCETLMKGSPELSTDEAGLLRRYLEYEGRGVPLRIFRTLDQVVTPGEIATPRIRFLPSRPTPDKITITQEDWAGIVRRANLQSRLESGWSSIFNYPEHGIVGLNSLANREQQDRARMGIYTLTDLLLTKAEEVALVTRRQFTTEARAEVDLPFASPLSNKIIDDFLTTCENDGLVRQSDGPKTASKLNLSGFLVTPLFKG